MKITAGNVTTERDIAAEADFLNVPWTITEVQEVTAENPAGTAVLLEGVQAFPLTVSADEVGEFLKKKLDTYKENVALHEAAKELQTGMDNAQEVAAKITNLEISE